MRIKNTEDFIKKAKDVHNNYYTYDKTNYVSTRTKMIITCPELCIKEDKDKIELLLWKQLPTGREVYEKEQQIIKENSEYLYTGPKILYTGNTELFKKDILNGEYTI